MCFGNVYVLGKLEGGMVCEGLLLCDLYVCVGSMEVCIDYVEGCWVIMCGLWYVYFVYFCVGNVEVILYLMLFILLSGLFNLLVLLLVLDVDCFVVEWFVIWQGMLIIELKLIVGSLYIDGMYYNVLFDGMEMFVGKLVVMLCMIGMCLYLFIGVVMLVMQFEVNGQKQDVVVLV